MVLCVLLQGGEVFPGGGGGPITGRRSISRWRWESYYREEKYFQVAVGVLLQGGEVFPGGGGHGRGGGAVDLATVESQRRVHLHETQQGEKNLKEEDEEEEEEEDDDEIISHRKIRFQCPKA